MAQRLVAVALVGQREIARQPFEICETGPFGQTVIRRQAIGDVGSARPHLGPGQSAPPSGPAIGFAQRISRCGEHQFDRAFVPALAGAPLHAFKGQPGMIRQLCRNGLDQRIDPGLAVPKGHARSGQSLPALVDTRQHALGLTVDAAPQKHVETVFVVRFQHIAEIRQQRILVGLGEGPRAPSVHRFGLGLFTVALQDMGGDQAESAAASLGRRIAEIGQHVVGSCAIR